MRGAPRHNCAQMAPAEGTAAAACEALATEEAVAALSFYGLHHWHMELRALEERLEAVQNKALKSALSAEEEELLGQQLETEEAGRRVRKRMGELLESPELTAAERPLACEFLKAQMARLHAEGAGEVKARKGIERLQALLKTVEARAPVADSRKMAKVKTELARLEKEMKELAPKHEQWEKGRFTFKSNDELQAFKRKFEDVQKGLASQQDAVEALLRLRGPEGSGSSCNAPVKNSGAEVDADVGTKPGAPQRQVAARGGPKAAAGAKGKKGAKNRKGGKADGDEDPAPVAESRPTKHGATVELLRSLVMDSCLVQNGRNMRALVKEEGHVRALIKDDGDSEGAAQSFEALKSRLSWHNSLGLATPANGEESKHEWRALWKREIDFGPRKSRRGTPGTDRIGQNLHANLPQYMHLVFALMLVRAFGRWGLLAWCFALQLGSLLVPLETLPKVSANVRRVCTLGVHVLVWLLFLYEAIWLTYFFEKLFIVCLVLGHAYVSKPADH